MDDLDAVAAIEGRRSIRKFKPEPVARPLLEELLTLAGCAPSCENTQPWKFVVLEGQIKDEVIEVIHDKATSLKKDEVAIGSCLENVRSMRQSPAIVMVYRINSEEDEEIELPSYRGDITDALSIGAAIENFLVAATAKGLGTLWIRDVLLAEEEINEIIEEEGRLMSALAVGHAVEQPDSLERKPLKEFVSWRE